MDNPFPAHLTETVPVPVYGSAAHAAQLTRDRHPGVRTAMAWLAFSHLPEKLKTISRAAYDAAYVLLERIPDDSAELTTALNRLVEAKDWFMRAGIRSDEGKPGPVPRPAEVVDPPAHPDALATRVCDKCGKKMTTYGFHYGTGRTNCS